MAQLLALAQTLVVAQVALGLLLLSDHQQASDHLHYAYGTFALLAVLSPWLYAPAEPRPRLLWFAGSHPRRRRPRRPRLHDRMRPLRPQPPDPGRGRAVIVVFDQQTALVTAGTLLRFAFFIAIAIVAYFYWRDFAPA